MKLNWRAKRRLSLLLLVVGLPIYIFVAVTVVGYLDRPPALVELGIYALAGIVWALPFKHVFTGIGTPDPDRPDGKE